MTPTVPSKCECINNRWLCTFEGDNVCQGGNPHVHYQIEPDVYIRCPRCLAADELLLDSEIIIANESYGHNRQICDCLKCNWMRRAAALGLTREKEG